MKVFATLGPAGSNHDLNTRRYLDFHGVSDAQIVYVSSFFDAVDRMRDGKIDFTIQVCAHPDVALTIERHYREIFLIDSFIGTTKAMGVVTRRDVEQPRSIGYMVATRGYFDLSRWETQIPQVSNSAVAEGLLLNRYDSGFTAVELAEQHPERFRVDQRIGEVDVVWLVYGRQRVNRGGILAWKNAPARAELFA